jgi:ankyrin repeat protein
LACKYNRQKIIDFLLSRPLIEMDVEDKNGHTPLTRAIQQENVDLVRQLAKRSSCENKRT